MRLKTGERERRCALFLSVNLAIGAPNVGPRLLPQRPVSLLLAGSHRLRRHRRDRIRERSKGVWIAYWRRRRPGPRTCSYADRTTARQAVSLLEALGVSDIKNRRAQEISPGGRGMDRRLRAVEARWSHRGVNRLSVLPARDEIEPGTLLDHNPSVAYRLIFLALKVANLNHACPLAFPSSR